MKKQTVSQTRNTCRAQRNDVAGATRRYKRVVVLAVGIVIAATLALCAFSLACYRQVQGMGNGTLVYYEYAGELPTASYILVPGGGAKEGELSLQSRYRLMRAAELYKEGVAEKVVASGGDAEEALLMRDALLAMGLPPEALWVDKHGEDTYASICRAVQLFPDERFYLCTQEQYASRAAYLLQKLGANGICINADLVIYQTPFIGRLREYLAATKAVLDGNGLAFSRPGDVGQFPIICCGGDEG